MVYYRLILVIIAVVILVVVPFIRIILIVDRRHRKHPPYRGITIIVPFINSSIYIQYTTPLSVVSKVSVIVLYS